MNHNSCITVSDSIDNNTAMAHYEFENLIYHTDKDREENCELPKELAGLLQQESRVIQPHQESRDIINLGTRDNKKEVKIGVVLEVNMKKKLIELLHEYVDVFT